MINDIDEKDYRFLLQAVLTKAIDDYVKLLHPKQRKRKYLQEYFLEAVDMFFDESYLMAYIQNESGEPMSLKDLVKLSVNSGRGGVKELQEHVVNSALQYWQDKDMNVVNIPETLQVDGHVYHVFHMDEVSYYEVDYKSRSVTLNKDDENSINQQTFIQATTEIMLYHLDIPIKKADIHRLSLAFYRLLKFNNCFVGD